MSNNKQQTGVQWFFDQLVANRIIVINGSTYWDKVKTKYEILMEQAKEMEKERTINFTEDWYFNGPLLGEGIDVKNTIEKHFNNTYGGGEQ